MNDTKIADKIGRENFPELAEVMNIRNELMDHAENLPGYEHEGSGAGLGSADFKFYIYDEKKNKRKYYKVEVEEIDEWETCR
jgi:hypothetical protein